MAKQFWSSINRYLVHLGILPAAYYPAIVVGAIAAALIPLFGERWPDLVFIPMLPMLWPFFVVLSSVKGSYFERSMKAALVNVISFLVMALGYLLGRGLA